MKLIFCPKCFDVRKLLSKKVFCDCGKSSGMYIDNLSAEIFGDAIPIGIGNSSFYSAIQNRSEYAPGVTFEAFVIQRKCDTIKEVKEEK